ncbi:MAG: alanine--tRNA ligase [Patescibacteria group bacterium]
MTSNEIRKKYLEFFESKGHKIIPSASLIPENDPTVLFTTAGMHPLVPFLLGEKHPAGQRLTNIQKCIRTGDIDEVGDDTHLTFFEMLGNWSLGDYWKKESITWSFEFLTQELKIDLERISVTCFAGDETVPRDNESAEIWKSLGISEEKIKFLGREDNWWGPAGETGPCGPDTEIFVDGVEIWNNVFMEYNKTKDGAYEPLVQKNVDTGMGLERTLMILNGQKNVFETDLFEGLLKDNSRESKIVADHIKAAVFILSEGIEPSNTGAGYVLRRLIRRAVRYSKDLDLTKLAEKIIEIYKDIYPELLKNKEKILDELKKEKEKFEKTLESGMKEFEKGTDPFVLFTSYGFPFELTKELAKEKGIEIDENKFNEELKKHQELSRTASSGMFKGGLSDSGEETKKLHTATHLLRRALEVILGESIMQKGSNITAERLRFDFNWSEKISEEQLKKVEDLVNEKIKEEIPVEMLELPKEEALKVVGTLSFDLSKYGDVVKVYKIGDFSAEFCGGPHVTNTSELGKFKIIKEEAVSAGVRRIKAILE